MSCNNRENSKGKVNVERNTYATGFEMAPSKTDINNASGMLINAAPSASELKQYLGVLICGASLWGWSWFILRDAVLPGGYLFSMAAVVAVGYIFGHTLERYTTLNPVIGMTLIGALYRNLGTDNYLNSPNADALDFHLRRIYPVIILSKGPLSWNWEYIKYNSVKVFSLATLPWIVECLSTAVFTHVLLKYPWYWGLHLGAILSSVSPAVIVPFANAFHARGLGTKNKVAALVANAGGLDTAFTEGMFGVINSAIFVSSTLSYRIVKALLAILVGIGLGVLWGILVDSLPDHRDIYAPTIRSLLIFFGGLLLSYGGGYLGWGGTCVTNKLGGIRANSGLHILGPVFAPADGVPGSPRRRPFCQGEPVCCSHLDTQSYRGGCIGSGRYRFSMERWQCPRQEHCRAAFQYHRYCHTHNVDFRVGIDDSVRTNSTFPRLEGCS